MDLKEIKAIIDLMKKNSIAEFELEQQDFKIRLKRGSNGSPVAPHYDDIPAAGPSALSFSNPNALLGSPGSASLQIASNEQEIKSPMIGTFYRAPSPESGNYVEIGSEVNPETIVCIIEAMKVMNEIKAEVKGVVTQVLLENSKAVEFGQPLFKIRAAP